MTNKIWHLCD